MEKLVYLEDCEVRLIRTNAGDQAVVDAARVSTRGGGSTGPSTESRDAGLINFLMRDRHGSPFEHGSFTFFIKAPIFVFREFHRHRAGWSYNEESGRYKVLDPEFYEPPAERPLIQVGKPGAYTYVAGTPTQSAIVADQMHRAYSAAWEAYQTMLEDGVAREVARMVLPVGIFSSMYATCNPRSLMHFLSLRTRDDRAKVPSGPQWEIDKLVAQKMENYLAIHMPLTYHAFNENGRVAP